MINKINSIIINKLFKKIKYNIQVITLEMINNVLTKNFNLIFIKREKNDVIITEIKLNIISSVKKLKFCKSIAPIIKINYF